MIPYHNERTLVYVIPLYVYISHNSSIRIEHVLLNDTQFFIQSEICTRPSLMSDLFISQLIRYARACSSYECFILRAMRLSNKLLGQGYVKERLKSSLRKFYGRYGDLTKQYEVPLSRMLHDILDDDHIQWHPPLIGHYTNFWPLLI